MKKKKKYSGKALTPAQLKFIDIYIETNNATEAVRQAFPEYKDATKSKIWSKANSTKRSKLIAEEISKRQKALQTAQNKHIATGQEVMEYLTDVMEGRIKDQFGLDAPLSERTKAAQELARRTVDFDNRMAGKADANINITLDWSR